MIYTRTNCGLRIVVKILEIFNEVLEGKCGKVPCYNTIENWMKKPGLSVYENDRKPAPNQKYAVVMDESIMVNREKLLLLLGILAEHQGWAIKHGDAVVLDMKVNRGFNGEDIFKEIDNLSKDIGRSPEYVISDQGHNLVKGISTSGLARHVDISHAMGNCLKHAYDKEPDLMAFTTLPGKVRLQYHLTDKAYLLPPNMRSIARFMNMSSWVDWGIRMLDCYDSLADYLKQAYSFIPKNKELLEELHASIEAVRHVNHLQK